MSEPNYAFCACMCPGVMNGCAHYEPNKPYKVCKTYKLLDEIAPERKFKLDKEKLEDIVSAARKSR